MNHNGKEGKEDLQAEGTTHMGEDSISSGESSVLRKSKASRALSMDTLMLDDRELDRDPRDCFCNPNNAHN